jgi:redox-sensitive bicupin YhaK (pirin superfamily)
MEIATYIVQGELTHWHIAHGHNDEAKESLPKGSLQFMSAGTGVTHSEGNNGDVPLRFIQMWITPRERGVRPVYGSVNGSTRDDKRLNQWDHLLTDVRNVAAVDCPAKINQDCNIFVSEMQEPVAYTLRPGRQAYVLAIEGPVIVQCEGATTTPSQLATYESGTAVGPCNFVFAPAADDAKRCHVLLVEMAVDSAAREF